MSDAKLLPDLKGSAVYLCKAANVLFYSLVTALRERDRTTGTPSAAVAPPRQTAEPSAGGILHARGPEARSHQRTRQVFMAAGTDVKAKKKKKNRTEEPKMRSLLEFMLGQKTEREIKARVFEKQRLP